MKTTPKIKTDTFIPHVSDDMNEFSDWDVTLMDGLENEPYLNDDEWDNVSGDLILF